MEGTSSNAPVLRYLSDLADVGNFTVVDVGCSGGIHPVWREFGPRLRAIGIDPNVSEVERLNKSERHAGVRYVAAFAGLPAAHPFLMKKGGRGDFSRSPWERLSVARSQEILRSRALSDNDKTLANLWTEVELADPSNPLFMPDYLRQVGIDNVDFIKIDVDGKDFEILNSFDSDLSELEVLGLGLEVNFFGSTSETDHTFHNTDRFLRERGFELFNLTLRRYSMAALPGKYVYHLPAPTEFGRILQGDALYLRDLGSTEYADLVEQLGDGKLLNLICLFAAFELPDCAAEIILRFRERISKLCDVEHVLDLLARQAQANTGFELSYKQWMERFDAQDAMFFRGNETGGPQAESFSLPGRAPRVLRWAARLLRGLRR